jgi:hypothetical protein
MMTSGVTPAACICLNASSALSYCPPLSYALTSQSCVHTLGVNPAACEERCMCPEAVDTGQSHRFRVAIRRLASLCGAVHVFAHLRWSWRRFRLLMSRALWRMCLLQSESANLFVPEEGDGSNVGFMYMQNAQPGGPTHFVFSETVRLILAGLARGKGSKIFNQDLFTAALITSAQRRSR